MNSTITCTGIYKRDPIVLLAHYSNGLLFPNAVVATKSRHGGAVVVVFVISHVRFGFDVVISWLGKLCHLPYWNVHDHLLLWKYVWTLRRRHIERDGVSNHRHHGCLLNCLFRHRSKKTWKLRVTGLCAGNSPVISEFPAQKASNA